jgi:hypothetical protein
MDNSYKTAVYIFLHIPNHHIDCFNIESTQDI